MDKSPHVLNSSSRELSYLLRHGLVKHHLKVHGDGWVFLNDILKRRSFRRNKINVDDIRTIVANDKKGRFSLKDESGKLYVRANQGHSVDVQIDMNPITKANVHEYPCVVHGTYLVAWEIIEREGLKPMNRQHIHFAKSASADSGIRKDAEVHIFIDVEKALEDGIHFFESENGVVLSPDTIASKYFRLVELMHHG